MTPNWQGIKFKVVRIFPEYVLSIRVSIQKRIGHQSVDGDHAKNNGRNLSSGQIGLLETAGEVQPPFLIVRKLQDHPSTSSKAIAKTVKDEIVGYEKHTPILNFPPLPI